MDIFSRALADVVRHKRKENSLTQVQMADLIHAEKRTIVNIEKGVGNPKLEILYPLIRALKINPLTVLYPETNHPRDAASQFLIFLSQCSDEEISFMLTVCEGVLTALHSNRALLKE